MNRFRRILRWLIGLPIAIAVISFAVANRQFVTVSLDPITPADPFASLNMPLWLLLFVGLLLGVVMGWIGAWWRQGKWRRKAKDAEAEIARLTEERDGLLNRETAAEKHIVPMGSSGWL